MTMTTDRPDPYRLSFRWFQPEFRRLHRLRQELTAETIRSKPFIDGLKYTEPLHSFADRLEQFYNSFGVKEHLLVTEASMTERLTGKNIMFHPLLGLTMKDDGHAMVTLRGKKTAATFLVLGTIRQLVFRNKYATKRDIYYRHCKYLDEQLVYEIIHNIACHLGVSRINLHVLTSQKGLIYGELTFYSTHSQTNCLQNEKGTGVPSSDGSIVTVRSTAMFLLVVEKEATFQRLIDLKVAQTLNCVIITGKGYPDANTREMVHLIWTKLKIPILGLFDADPHGIEIMSVYRFGSRSMAYDAVKLVVPQVRWLGIFPSDLIDYQLPQHALLRFKDTDRAKLKTLHNSEGIRSNPHLKQQVELLESMGSKAEIQALDELGVGYLGQYLYQKVAQGQWL